MLKKIQSETGASLSFALLIFLVCTVVGSVILTSGTASSGRLSRLKDVDTRYYSVESAANLIRKTMDGRVVNAVYEIEDDDITGDITFEVNGDDDMFSSMLTEAVQSVIQKESISTPWHTLTFSGNLSGTTLDQINATAMVKLNTNGIMNFVVSNTDDEETYSVSMDIEPDFHQREETVTEVVTVDDEEQEVEKTYVYVTVTWKGGEIRVA